MPPKKKPTKESKKELKKEEQKTPKKQQDTPKKTIEQSKKLQETTDNDVELDYTIDDIDLNDDSEIEEINTEIPDLEPIIKPKHEYKPIISQDIIILHEEHRRTSDVMTIFEYTNIISQRALQINAGGPCYTNVDDLTNPLEMATKELQDKKCPLNIQRSITDKIYEQWSANELSLPRE